MAFKYEKLMQEWEMNMDNPILDPAYVTKVKDFQTKLEKRSLNDDEITAWDNEICKMFVELHELREEDNPEMTKTKHRADMNELKNKIAEAETLEQVNALAGELENFPELQPFFDKRLDKLQKAAQSQQQAQVLQEINSSPYETLPSLLEKYKDHPDLVKSIEHRIEKEKPQPKDKTKRELLSEAKKREWTYDELRAIGITPTGDDMEVEGVYLQRQYMFKVYRITKVDGQKI